VSHRLPTFNLLSNESASTTAAANAAPRSLVGICTLNEADNITHLITSLRESLPEADILVVDDDSKDDTAGLVGRIAEHDDSVRVVVRTDQRGLGSAIRHAMNYAIEHDYSYFLNLDGDLSHDPHQLPALLQRALESPQVDVVIGSRYVSGGSIVGWPIHRKLMSRMINRFSTLCLRLPVKDCSGAMRCYRVDALARLGMANLHYNGYAMLEELLWMLDRQGAPMAEVPITFTDRRQGESKLTLGEAARSITQMLALAVKR
jgi:dolichol-phosphate mannosyltransferase